LKYQLDEKEKYIQKLNQAMRDLRENASKTTEELDLLEEQNTNRETRKRRNSKSPTDVKSLPSSLIRIPSKSPTSFTPLRKTPEIVANSSPTTIPKPTLEKKSSQGKITNLPTPKVTVKTNGTK